ncbi:hypothetical protein ACIQF6_25650 [Kitasatospora sp. NPDC092948]|uniref:hypothetical protein n=1 Tax=Kitasatospora sp. NPDC092948 TaxID=3364088 RepID=UPI00382BB10B
MERLFLRMPGIGTVHTTNTAHAIATAGGVGVPRVVHLSAGGLGGPMLAVRGWHRQREESVRGCGIRRCCGPAAS